MFVERTGHCAKGAKNAQRCDGRQEEKLGHLKVAAPPDAKRHHYHSRFEYTRRDVNTVTCIAVVDDVFTRPDFCKFRNA